jgi:glutathionylspermidine synthase
MPLHSIVPRPDWKAQLSALGMELEAGASPYWREDAYYAFSEREVEILEDASTALLELIEQAVEHVVARDRLAEVGIPEPLHPLVVASWRRRYPSLYGRFDLRFDGDGPPKLLEYNADTPTALFEASVVQWHWLEQRFPDLDQWNSIHEGLIERWREIGARLPQREGAVSTVPAQAGTRPAPLLHFACMPEDDDDLLTTAYLQDTAGQAGIDTRFLRMADIGWDGRRFVDLEHREIRALFKLYPWDWLARETFFPGLVRVDPWVIEPAWRLVPASKGILAVLWELFPGHPNLLPASLALGRISGDVIRKPLLGREGANMVVTSAAGMSATEGPYSGMAVVEQAFVPLPAFDGFRPVLGVWVAGREARGLGIREDRALVTGRGASFVPHVMEV